MGGSIIGNNRQTVCLLRAIVHEYHVHKWAYLQERIRAAGDAPTPARDFVKREMTLSYDNALRDTGRDNCIDRRICRPGEVAPYADTPDLYGLCQCMGVDLLVVYTNGGTLAHLVERFDGRTPDWEACDPLEPFAVPTKLRRGTATGPVTVVLVHSPGHYRLGRIMTEICPVPCPVPPTWPATPQPVRPGHRRMPVPVPVPTDAAPARDRHWTRTYGRPRSR